MAESPTILVIGPRWVGDMVMAQCLFSALRQLHPGAAIDVLAPNWAAPLVGRMPEIRRQIDFPLKTGSLEFLTRRRYGRELSGRYDMAYVLPGSWKSALIPFFARIPRRVGFLREMRYGLLTDIVPLPDTLKRRTAEAFFALARGGSFRYPKLTVDAANQSALLERHGLADKGFVAMMPGAEFGPAKRWPMLRRSRPASCSVPPTRMAMPRHCRRWRSGRGATPRSPRPIRRMGCCSTSPAAPICWAASRPCCAMR